MVAGAATFAAFPAWYATMFSGFYLALLLILVLLIVRAVVVRVAGAAATTRAGWASGAGRTRRRASARRSSGASRSRTSLHGVPLDADGHLRRRLPRPLQRLHGARRHRVVALFALHGATFLTLRTGGDLGERAAAAARRLAIPVAIVGIAVCSPGPSRSPSTATTGTSSRRPSPAALGGARAPPRAPCSSGGARSGWAFAMTAPRRSRSSRRSSPASIRACSSPTRRSPTASRSRAPRPAHYTLTALTIVGGAPHPALPALPGLDLLRLARTPPGGGDPQPGQGVRPPDGRLSLTGPAPASTPGASSLRLRSRRRCARQRRSAARPASGRPSRTASRRRS